MELDSIKELSKCINTDLVPCLFCTKIVPLKSNKRLPNFWLKVSMFCEAVDLPRDSFENGFKFSPFCTECAETIVAVASIQKSIDELEVKLDLYKDKINSALKQEYSIERTEEAKINAFKHFSPSKFRERIREQLGIISKPPPVETAATQTLLSNLAQTVYSPENSPIRRHSDTGKNENSENDDKVCLDQETSASATLAKVTDDSDYHQKSDPSRVETVPKKLGTMKSIKTSRKQKYVLRKRKNTTILTKESSKKKETPSKIENLATHKTQVTKHDNGSKKEKQLPSLQLETKVVKSIEPKKITGGRKYFNPNLVVKCTHVDPEKGPCNRKFTTEEKMGIHIRRYHLKVPKNDLIQCPQCPRTVSNTTRLAEHMKLHTGETDIPCEICGMLFRTEYIITKHKVRVHGKPFPFVCEYCNEGFFTKAELRYHSYSHTGEWPYPCDECDSGFPSKARLERHKQYNHYDALHICQICGRKYQSVAILKKHEKSHETGKRFKCETCGWSFRFQSALKSHFNSVHTDNRPFLCQECGAAFKLNKHLLVHLKGHDDRKRPFLARTRQVRPPPSTVVIVASAPTDLQSDFAIE